MDRLITGLDAQRQELLLTKGLMALKVEVPPPSEDGWFKWLMPLDKYECRDLRWFIDGSALDGPHQLTTRLGFAIVVTSFEGQLVAYAFGCPPAWVRDAPGAEAWALLMVAESNAQLPHVVTDCLGLVNTAAAGRSNATTAQRPQARIWNRLFDRLDSTDLADACHNSFVWMPSHCSLSVALRRTKSDGRLITKLEWRANRLVDALAQTAAGRSRLPRSLMALIRDVERTVEYAAGMVGLTSWAANNFVATRYADNGDSFQVTLRDSCPPKTEKIGTATGTGQPKRGRPKAAAPSSSAPTRSTPPPPPRKLLATAQKAAELTAEVGREARATSTWLKDLAAKSLTRDDAAPTARERLNALRLRVREKAASQAVRL